MLDKYAAAVIAVVAEGSGVRTTCLVRRVLNIGYNSAAHLIERMERDGIISAPSSNGVRTVLCHHVRELPINVEWDETGPDDEIELLYREERQQHAIAALEHALDDARSGDLTGFAFTAIGRPGANQVAMAYSFDETDPAILHEMVDATRTLLVEVARGGK